MVNYKQVPIENKNEEQKADEYVTRAIIKPMNIYDSVNGRYTTEINLNVVKVETFVNDLKTEKPVTIGYINVKTLQRFLDGDVKAVPIKMRN